ncbi:MAG: hypothetical protein Q4G05_03045 [Clostridia bacterium]|nr:hypothetical protein [Clostridia bacterium]
MQRINLNEFDTLGIFNLKNVDGIERFVTKYNKGYLSRNKEYYKERSYKKANELRNYLKTIMNNECSKKNFVIVENMLNLSARAYFRDLEKSVINNNWKYEKSKKCLEEDVHNIINLFNNKELSKATEELPISEDVITSRIIEMDNKALLYIFTKNLIFNKDKHIVTPGLGSIFIGPFMKELYGYEYTNIVFSLYAKNSLNNNSLIKMFSNNKWLTTTNSILLIDDNIATGRTINKLKEFFKENKKEIKYGAVKYNWINYYNVSKGIEKKLDTFNISDVDFLTPFEDPGYWMARNAINGLVKNNSGEQYVNELQKEGYRDENVSDFMKTLLKTEEYLNLLNIDFYGNQKEITEIKKSSIYFSKKLKIEIEKICNERGREER